MPLAQCLSESFFFFFFSLSNCVFVCLLWLLRLLHCCCNLLTSRFFFSFCFCCFSLCFLLDFVFIVVAGVACFIKIMRSSAFPRLRANVLFYFFCFLTVFSRVVVASCCRCCSCSSCLLLFYRDFASHSLRFVACNAAHKDFLVRRNM